MLCSATLLMLLRRQSIQILIFIGRTLMRNIISPVNSQPILLPWTMQISLSPAHIRRLLEGEPYATVFPPCVMYFSKRKSTSSYCFHGWNLLWSNKINSFIATVNLESQTIFHFSPKWFCDPFCYRAMFWKYPFSLVTQTNSVSS